MRERSDSSQPADEDRHEPSWDSLARLAFAADWDPASAIAWEEPIDRGRIPAGWIAILHHFYEGEWQGLEIIQRLMNRAAHQFRSPEMVTYYSTQCYDESKHLYAFRMYLEKLGAPPPKLKTFDLLVALATRGPMAIERWILATYFTETLAAAIFRRSLHLASVDGVGKSMIQLMLRDESRHIAGTRVALRAMIRRTGALKRWLLRAWWRVFLPLAIREVRRLGAHGDDIGIDPDDVLEDTVARMRQMPEFVNVFLHEKVAGRRIRPDDPAVPP